MYIHMNVPLSFSLLAPLISFLILLNILSSLYSFLCSFSYHTASVVFQYISIVFLLYNLPTWCKYILFVCTCMYVCVCVCVYIYIYIYICVCVCVCIYIYIYIYIYTHTPVSLYLCMCVRLMCMFVIYATTFNCKLHNLECVQQCHVIKITLSHSRSSKLDVGHVTLTRFFHSLQSMMTEHKRFLQLSSFLLTKMHTTHEQWGNADAVPIFD